MLQAPVSSLESNITSYCQRILSIINCRTAELPGPGSSRKTSTDSTRHQKPYAKHQRLDTRRHHLGLHLLPVSLQSLLTPGSSRETPPDSRLHQTTDTRHQTWETRHQTSLQSYLAPCSSRGTPPALCQPLILKEWQIDKGQSVGCYQSTKWLGTGWKNCLIIKHKYKICFLWYL